ncbi:roadblock/LC7 domain-containing protein [Nonomuraea candida]|uniref:roadblock/LC7 domain-containing protein n=1 Tax=Nonomuraea candida TaxID=359159 RepID=UPI0005B847F3|nr:hypothetical protein [Nonomuraea candida]
MNNLSNAARGVDWLITDFVSTVPGVAHAVVVSSDGLVEMQRGLMLIMSISDGSCLAVLAAPDCDMGLVAYQMTLMVDRAGQVLTPAVRAELRASQTR